MIEFLSGSAFFGAALTIGAFWIGLKIKDLLKHPVFNPIWIGGVIVVLVLLIGKIPYEHYESGAKYISFLLTPATICLAIPLYEKFELLKKNLTAVLVGITSGVITSLISVCGFSILLGLSRQEYVTLLPKSITTAIGMGLSAELGGIPSITVASIIVTGILGNIVAESVCRIAKIEEPIARGIAIGTSAHAMGTSRALEIGATEGAMSSLSMVVAGLLTTVGAPIFANFIH